MQEPIINIAISAARAAGTMIARAIDQPDKIQITEKNPNDFVTNIDREVEKKIISIIQKAYPKHGILAEECGEISGSDTVWIIDPIDGTRNFMHGLPHFSISIAIERKGKIEHGVIYDPIRQELFTASRGRGARLNDRRIRVSTHGLLKDALLGTGFSARRSPEYTSAYAHLFQTLLPVCGDVRRAGSAALDLAYIACGRLDGYWELGLKPWDIAAGILLIKEAGGLICDPQGEEKYYESGNIVAGNPKILKALIKYIKPEFSKLLRG